MLQDLNREVVTWLGYLQRGSVLLQLAIMVSTVLVEKRSRWTRRLNSELFSSFAELASPLLLILLGAAIKALGFPGGLVQYLATLWLLWRLFKPINLLIEQRFPNLPVDELDRMLFRPLLLVFTVLSFFQILGSRESLAIIEIGDVFGVTLTVGKLFTALTITYLVVAYAKRIAKPRSAVGKLHRDAGARFLRDLDRVKSDDRFPYIYDRDQADRALQFFRTLKHYKGEWAGQPLILEPFQQFILSN